MASYLLLEIAAIVAVTWAIGYGWMLLALLVGAVLGGWLARREGRRALAALGTAVRAGASGQEELTDGVLIAAGGVAIMLPGFLSDLIGLALLLRPSRGLLRRYWLRRIERRAPGSRASSARGTGTVVDGEVVDQPHDHQPGDHTGDDSDRPARRGSIIELPPQ